MEPTDATTVELTPRQQQLLLRGLQFVRSSVSLDMQIPSEDVEQSRSGAYEELDALESKLASERPRQPR